MKTAMQELIEHIQVNATKFSLMNTYNILKEIEPYLEKEKENIQKAFSDGQETPINHPNIPHYSRDEYYNDNYNQNK
jgi:hypothetical protein